VRVRALVAIPAALLALFVATPIAALALHLSPAIVTAAFASPAVRSALILSLLTTFGSLAIILVLGTPLGFALARGRFAGKALLEALVDLPIVLPPAVAGLALLLAFGRSGLFGALLDRTGITIAFTSTAVVFAQVFVAAPFYVRAARTSFAGADRTLEEASATLGYGELGTFARITLPLSLPALLGGATLSWARALGEFGATLMFAGNLIGVSQTMPLAVYLGLESGQLDEAIALSLILVAISAGVLAGIRRLRWA
jgi:molybdate transport system permease protein